MNKNLYLPMHSITVTKKQNCIIYQKNNLLSDVSLLLKIIKLKSRIIVIISNNKIINLYGKILLKNLKNSEYITKLIIICDGEKHKNINVVNSIYKKLIFLNITRNDTIISFGGGVISDITGFVASTFMRGITLINIPTTLLAMIDASIGGKTGINSIYGKNLIGSFYFPKAILIDPCLLKSLTYNNISNGVAEMIKHGIIDGKELFNKITLHNLNNDVSNLIKDTAVVKIKLIRNDPFEYNNRILLNFGHTFGHAIELCSNYSISHGKAVALGMIAATNLSKYLNICKENLPKIIIKSIKAFQLSTSIAGYTATQIFNNIKSDKKNMNNSLYFVLPVDIGTMRLIRNPPISTVIKSINSILI